MDETHSVPPTSSAVPFTGTGGGDCEGHSVAGPLVDPLDKLEVVWSSLESWFNLIVAEVEKTEGGAGGRGLMERGTDLLKKRILSIDDSVARATVRVEGPNNGASGAQSSGKSEGARNVIFEASDTAQSKGKVMRRKKKASRESLTLNVTQSNHLAAAIVKSTPVERRVAYLR